MYINSSQNKYHEDLQRQISTYEVVLLFAKQKQVTSSMLWFETREIKIKTITVQVQPKEQFVFTCWFGFNIFILFTRIVPQF